MQILHIKARHNPATKQSSKQSNQAGKPASKQANDKKQTTKSKRQIPQVRPSVGPSVGPSVRPSVRPPVRPSVRLFVCPYFLRFFESGPLWRGVFLFGEMTSSSFVNFFRRKIWKLIIYICVFYSLRQHIICKRFENSCPKLLWF